MTARDLHRTCISETGTIRDALQVIDDAATTVALITSADGVLAGLLTDGDVRRAVLAGADLDDPALPFATKTPSTVSAGSPRALVLDLLRARHLTVVPEVDEGGRLVGLHTLFDVVGSEPLPNVAVIMAGGKGTRLGELTRDRPKPLMTVAGRTILEWIILNLVGDGIREIYVSVNYLAEQIEEHLADGSRLGCQVHYLREEPDNPLGTAGSLTLLRDRRPDLHDPVLVMNGDLMVQFGAQELLDRHERSGARLTMATRSYQHEIPFGVVDCDDAGFVTGISEKPTISVDINTAVYAVDADALELLPDGRPSTMPELVQQLLDRGDRVATWTMSSDWIDVGTPKDLARAKGQA